MAWTGDSMGRTDLQAWKLLEGIVLLSDWMPSDVERGERDALIRQRWRDTNIETRGEGSGKAAGHSDTGEQDARRGGRKTSEGRDSPT